MAVPGGLTPRRVDQYAAAGAPPPSPAPQGGTITAQRVIITGTAGELLVYSGQPALGNLIYSVSGAPVPFKDNKGNLVLQGSTNYFFNSGAPNYEAIQLWDGQVTLLATALGVGQGGPYSVTNGSFAPINGGVSLVGTTEAQVTGGADIMTWGNGYPQGTFGGITGSLVNSQSDGTAITVTTATAITRISKAYTIPANNAIAVAANTTYRIKFGGNGVMGAAAVGFSFVCAMGGTGSLDWDLTWPASSLAAGNTFAYVGEVNITIATTGAAGTWNFSGSMILTDITTGNSAPAALQDNGNVHSTLVPETVEIDFQWAAVSAGRTVTNQYSSFERVGV